MTLFKFDFLRLLCQNTFGLGPEYGVLLVEAEAGALLITESDNQVLFDGLGLPFSGRVHVHYV